MYNGGEVNWDAANGVSSRHTVLTGASIPNIRNYNDYDHPEYTTDFLEAGSGDGPEDEQNTDFSPERQGIGNDVFENEDHVYYSGSGDGEIEEELVYRATTPISRRKTTTTTTERTDTDFTFEHPASPKYMDEIDEQTPSPPRHSADKTTDDASPAQMPAVSILTIFACAIILPASMALMNQAFIVKTLPNA